MRYLVEAREELIGVLIRVVGLTGHGLEHPLPEFRHELESVGLLLLRIQRLQNMLSVTAQLYGVFVLVKRVQMVLDLLAPVQIFHVDLTFLVDLVQVGVLA